MPSPYFSGLEPAVQSAAPTLASIFAPGKSRSLQSRTGQLYTARENPDAKPCRPPPHPYTRRQAQARVGSPEVALQRPRPYFLGAWERHILLQILDSVAQRGGRAAPWFCPHCNARRFHKSSDKPIVNVSKQANRAGLTGGVQVSVFVFRTKSSHCGCEK